MTFGAIYDPQVVTIESITNANPCVITTTVDHNFNPGLYVRIFFPYTDGVEGIVGNIYLITILSPTSFSIPVDTSNMDPFTTDQFQIAQVVPVAELASTLQNSVTNVAFILLTQGA